MKTEQLHIAHSSHCHNCGAAVSYHYCSVCGQETKLHVPSAREFIHEFIGHYVALEGRLWKTLYYLLCKPGFLTAEYIAGRRVRYVEPLRIYLTFSILFFAVLKLSGPTIAQIDGEQANQAVVIGTTAHPARAVPPDVKGFEFDKLELGFSPTIEAKVNKFLSLPAAEKSKMLASAFYSYVPYAMFLLMPVFALYLKLLYLGTGRRYGEHLLFALHTNAFAFMTLAIVVLISPLGLGVVQFALVSWLLFYLPTAMRRVYGGSRALTALRWLTLGFLHFLSIFGAIAVALSLAVIK